MAKYVRFRYIPRIKTLPATVVGYNRAGQTTKGAVHKLTHWEESVVRGMNTDHANNYIFKPASGWINSFNEDGFPLTECVAFSGNIAKVLGYLGGRYLLDAIRPGQPIPTDFDPLKIHRFTCVNWLGQPRPPGDGITAYVAFISEGEFWVPERNVEVFDYIPNPVWPASETPPPSSTVYITLKAGTVLYQRPDGPKVLKLTRDTTFPVLMETNYWVQVGLKLWARAI